MKLLILYTKSRTEVFNRKSAIGSYIYCLSDILQSEGHSVFLNGRPFQAEIITQRENVKPGGLKKSITKLIPSFLRRAIRDRLILKQADSIADELNGETTVYDAILEFYNLGSQAGLKLAKAQGIPLNIVYDSPVIEEYVYFNNGAKPFFLNEFKRREKATLSNANKTVVYSNPMKDYVQSIYKQSGKVLLHQNVDFSRFDIMENNKQLSAPVKMCFIGSFLKWHQVDLLVEVCANLIKTGANIELYLVGDGMEKIKIEEQVSQLDPVIKSKIHFTGFLDGEALYDLKKNMHIGVMPGSNWYGAPNKIFEYGAMKMAVVAPNTPTILDLFTESEISFFEWKNKKSLNDSILNLISNKAILQEKTRQLNHFILKKYSLKNTKDFYTELISDK